MPQSPPASDVPLVIDLDGTLLLTDVLFESVVSVVKKAPWRLIQMPFWLLRGRVHFKARLAELADFPVHTLPKDLRVLKAVKDQSGRHRVLCTAADARIAEQISADLGCFEEVIASDGHLNLAGRRKAEALLARFGERGFDYAGNTRADLYVWQHARRGWVVNAGHTLVEAATRLTEIECYWPDEVKGLEDWVRALRLHQWLKNLLIFVPLLASHQALVLDKLLLAAWSFLAFSLCASAIYVANDLADLASDREHLKKRYRPFASGQLSLLSGLWVAPLLTFTALCLSWAISPVFFLWLGAYVLLTTAYSLFLKRMAIADVMTLAGLYTLRVLGGAAAVAVPVSSWLLAFSVFIFLSLALVKRYTELYDLRGRGKTGAAGRGYRTEDLSLLSSMGAASGYVAALVLALYVDAAGAAGLYREPLFLWGLCPILLGWISRVWLIAHRGGMHDDPIVFAVRDQASWGFAAASLILIWAAL